MSDCRSCIFKHNIEELSNGYHCYKSGLDFEDGVRGPNCICRDFYDAYNYMRDQDAIQERNKDDLLAAIAFGGDLLPDDEEEQRTEGDDKDFKAFLFLFGCFIALAVSEQHGFLGLLVFAVPYGIIRIIRKMDSDLLWKIGFGAVIFIFCFCAVVSYDDSRITNYKRLLENIYQKESWFTGKNGEITYLSIGGDRPFMPLPDGHKRINIVLSNFLREHNERAEQRARERKAGFDHPYHPMYDQKLQAYFLGERIQIVSSNAPQGLFKALKEHRAEKFDWQAFEKSRGK